MFCKNIYCCSFFHKYNTREHLVWKSMITDYCKNGKQECVRLMIMEKNGLYMSEDLLPIGFHATKPLLSLP